MDDPDTTSSNPRSQGSILSTSSGSADPSTPQPSIPCNIIVLPLAYFESHDYFQQMLSIDSALQALVLAKENILAQTTRPHWRPREQLEHFHQSMGSLDKLMKTFEALQKTARHNHMRWARSLREKESGIMDLPDELLLMIFGKFRPLVNTQDANPTCGFGEAKYDIRTIVAIRLTCHLFHRVTSHLIVRRIDISLNQASLDQLDRVVKDQSIWSAERVFEIDLRYYSTILAQDFEAFAEHCIVRLGDKVRDFDKRLARAEKLVRRKSECERGDGEESQLSCISMEKFRQCADEAHDIVSSWRRIAHQDATEEPADADEAACALWREYQNYRQLYQEQEELLREGRFAKSVALAAAATKSRVWLSMSDGKESHWDVEGYATTRQFDEHGPSDLKLFADPANLVKYIMVRPRQWCLAESIDEGQVASRSLLYEIPLAMQTAGARMAGFTVDLSHYPISHDRRLTGDHIISMEAIVSDPAVSCSFRLRRPQQLGPDPLLHRVWLKLDRSWIRQRYS